MYVVAKRFADIIMSLLFMPIVLLIILVIGLVIKSEDNGPILYRSARVGKNGNIFNMYKLRTMFVNAPDIRLADGATYNSDNDPRVTKIGRWLRKTSIDEVPQLINILIGDMSIIGPRPSTPYWLTICKPEELDILKVLPGLTGYNQAFFRNSISDAEKYQNDLLYVKNMSLRFDLKIFLKTIEVVLKRKNIFNN